MIKSYSNRNVDISLITTALTDLGIRSLSSVLKQNGYRPVLGFFNSLSEYYLVGELKEIGDWIERVNPVNIGISSIEYSRKKSQQLIKYIKERFPDKRVLVGGLDTLFQPESYLQFLSERDLIVRGEGERILSEILSGKKPEQLPSLIYKKGGRTFSTPLETKLLDINKIPWEDWLDYEHHFDLKNGKIQQKSNFVLDNSDHPILWRYDKSVYMFTVRGCPYACSYCVNSKLHEVYKGQKFTRKRSVEDIIKRAEQLIDRNPKINIFYFFDDDFFATRSLEEIKSFSKEWGNKVSRPFFVYGCPNTVTEEKLKPLVDVGLVVVNSGVQTADESMLFKLYNRKMPTKNVYKMHEIISKYIGKGLFGLDKPWYDMIINNPYEPPSALKKNITLLTKLEIPFRTDHHSLEIFQNSKLYDKAKRDGIIKDEDLSARLNFHDTYHHFKIRKPILSNEQYYLNSILYWLTGTHNRKFGVVWDGVIPRTLVKHLISNKTINFMSKNVWLVDLLNCILPTEKRKYFLKQSLMERVTRIKCS